MLKIFPTWQGIHRAFRNTTNTNSSCSDRYHRLHTSHIQGNQRALTVICVTHIICVHDSNEGKSAENFVQVYLSDILVLKGGSIAILSDKGTEFKNKVLNEANSQLEIKRLFYKLLHTQGNARVENVHNFLNQTHTKFLEYSNLEWD